MAEMTPAPHIKTQMIPLSEFRTQIAMWTARVSHISERILLTKHGRPFAAVVSMRDLEMIERFDSRSVERLRQDFEETARRFEAAQEAGREGARAAGYPGSGEGGYRGVFED
ncbi:type II toxin-antitoxin system Phd/YefM family antitoxin [Aliiruegeria lutimaris]|uniref:Antitoxin n=1 Tax=Aliiruegeria lutimaris TaxID=571298 RepID=A0A1G8ZQ22_9RHOB|nr:type II toxin-antitoxin system Phd/YefM family antitoxin [Aliiruegeria lutimaris]SDK17202.1 prevent-host-death family protein [Aliiruegeria lutimaris]